MTLLDEKIRELNDWIDEENEKNRPLIEANKKVYTVDEIQDILQVGRNSAYALTRAGHFKCFRIGGHIRISKQSFDDWLDGVTPPAE